MQDKNFDAVLEAMDDLALAWLDFRTGAESRELARRIVDELIEDGSEDGTEQPERTEIVEEDLPEFVTVLEASRISNLHPSSLGHWIVEGLIESTSEHAGRSAVIPRREAIRLKALYDATPVRYKKPARYIGRMLRIERYGDPKMRPHYPSERRRRSDNGKAQEPVELEVSERATANTS